MLIGINQAWFEPINGQTNYGHDLTHNFDPDNVRQTLLHARAAGMTAIRLWAFEGSNSFPEGIDFQGFKAQRINESMRQNLIKVMEIAAEIDILIYWTLLAPNVEFSKEHPADPKFLEFYSRMFNVAEFADEACALIYVAVVDFLKIMQPFENQIFAIDICNEIDFAAQFYLKNHWFKTQAIHLWLQAVEQQISQHFSGSRPRLGVSFANSNDGYPMLYEVVRRGYPFDFVDVHAYSDDGKIPLAAPLSIPLILGEYGQKKDMFCDDTQDVTTQKFLQNAKNLGCIGAFAWRLLEHNEAKKHWSFFHISRLNDGALAIGQPRAAVDSLRNLV